MWVSSWSENSDRGIVGTSENLSLNQSWNVQFLWCKNTILECVHNIFFQAVRTQQITFCSGQCSDAQWTSRQKMKIFCWRFWRDWYLDSNLYFATGPMITWNISCFTSEKANFLFDCQIGLLNLGVFSWTTKLYPAGMKAYQSPGTVISHDM